MAYSHDRLTHLSSLASEAMRRREYGQCIELLEEASKLAPKNWNILINLAQLLISRYEFEAAEKYFEKAIRVSKDEGSVCSLAAPSFFNARQNEIAIKYLHRLLKLNPQSAEVLTFLATIHERQGGMAQTADFIDAALQLKPGYVPALLIKARLLRKEGHPEAAGKVLRQIASESQAEPDLRAQAWCELGKLLDSESQFDEAISAFLSAKELLLPHAAKGLNDRRRTQAHTTMMINSVSADSLTRWKADGLAITPVHRIALLAGHPRSGTTLLEQVLDAHPDVRSLEESPIFFNEAYLPLIHRLPSENHFRALDSVSVSQLSAPRSNYFKLVERFMGLDASGSLLIDKNPSLTPFIPAFAKIFPESRFLIALRDPRDVCMSCFMQYLPMGPVASTFLSLEETVHEYVSVMDSWLTLRSKLPNPYLEIRYEDLVQDIGASARRVLDFLDLPWDPRVLEFNQHAKDKRVHSPTYADVIKPIYKSAIGRWKNYAHDLEPHLEKLEPFVKAFGYA